MSSYDSTQFQIKLTKDEVCYYSEIYRTKYAEDDRRVSELVLDAIQCGCMSREELLEVAKWKYPGQALQNRIQENSNEEIREHSRASFSAITDRLRIGALLALRGINWPMASVVLHFAFPKEYPILDVRAMSTVGGDTNYNFAKWMGYAEKCRSTALNLGVSLRELDRALWLSDIHQKLKDMALEIKVQMPELQNTIRSKGEHKDLRSKFTGLAGPKSIWYNAFSKNHESGKG